jgi:hypothetical protein
MVCWKHFAAYEEKRANQHRNSILILFEERIILSIDSRLYIYLYIFIFEKE